MSPIILKRKFNLLIELKKLKYQFIQPLKRLF